MDIDKMNIWNEGEVRVCDHARDIRAFAEHKGGGCPDLFSIAQKILPVCLADHILPDLYSRVGDAGDRAVGGQ